MQGPDDGSVRAGGLDLLVVVSPAVSPRPDGSLDVNGAATARARAESLMPPPRRRRGMADLDPEDTAGHHRRLQHDELDVAVGLLDTMRCPSPALWRCPHCAATWWATNRPSPGELTAVPGGLGRGRRGDHGEGRTEASGRGETGRSSRNRQSHITGGRLAHEVPHFTILIGERVAGCRLAGSNGRLPGEGRQQVPAPGGHAVSLSRTGA